MTMQEMLDAIAIFRKYIRMDWPAFHAEHDVLTGPHVDELKHLKPDDRAALEQQGWHIGEYDCWLHYCSC